jgi:16S rRNA (guanine966-N2)-methyltransferase
MDTRPILDRIKKSLFSMLDAAGLLAGTRVADLYAGTGTQGIEALSRGAAYCLFVERRADAIKLLNQNLQKTRLAEFADVRCGLVTGVLNQLAAAASPPPFDLILYDPPFAFSAGSDTRAAAEAEMALAGKLLALAPARLVLRFEKKAEPPAPAGLVLARHWTDGPHAFAFYQRS